MAPRGTATYLQARIRRDHVPEVANQASIGAAYAADTESGSDPVQPRTRRPVEGSGMDLPDLRPACAGAILFGVRRRAGGAG